jgi:hypothetical protein
MLTKGNIMESNTTVLQAAFEQFVTFMKALERDGELPEPTYASSLTEKLWQCFCAGVRYQRSLDAADDVPTVRGVPFYDVNRGK